MSVTAADIQPHRVTRQELLGLQQQAKRLNASPRQKSAAQITGQHQAIFRARGMEFEEHRVYSAGDDIRSIDWRVTARTGQAHSKQFREERERPVLIAIDLGANMQYATQGRFKAVRAIQAGIFTAWIVAQRGDRVGGIIMAGDQHREIKPSGGKHGPLKLIHAALDLQDAPKTQTVSTELGQLTARLRRLSNAGTQTFLYSDLQGWNTETDRQLRLLMRHSPTTIGKIFDPIEQALPMKERGQLNFISGEKRASISSANHKQREGWSAAYAEAEQAQKQSVLASRGNWLTLSTAEDPITSLRQSFQTGWIRAAWVD